MPHWIRLVTFTERGVDYLRNNPQKFLAEMNRVIQENDGKLLGAFATLGPFDVMSIIEASSENTMQRIDEAVEEQGYYTTETYHAIPAKEYLETVARSPIFLSSWLRGRDVAQAEALASSGRPRRPRAASKTRKRPIGVETRQVSRSRDSLADKASIVFDRVKPLIEAAVANISLADGDKKGGLAFRLSFEDAQRVDVTDWQRNMPLKLRLKIEGDRQILDIAAQLVRVDLVDMEQYEVAVCYEGLTRAALTRLEKLLQPPKGK